MIDRLAAILQAERKVGRLPRTPISWHMIINPLAATRHHEFAYLLKFIRTSGWRGEDILDVGSPYLMAYILSDYGHVVKTDIDGSEGRFVRPLPSLRFQQEDARALSFADDTFDLVYSISVVEHIYRDYPAALAEMARVLNPGGYLCLTFPVADSQREEWLDAPAYPAQHRRGSEYFFQYRFAQDAVDGIVRGLPGMSVIDRTIYWERRPGAYDRLMARLRRIPQVHLLTAFLAGAINLWSCFGLFELEPNAFGRGRGYGNLLMILRKDAR